MTEIKNPIQFWLNGALQTHAGAADETLLSYLRQSGRVGTKEGCAEGDCGACTVLVGHLQDGALHYLPVNGRTGGRDH